MVVAPRRKRARTRSAFVRPLVGRRHLCASAQACTMPEVEVPRRSGRVEVVAQPVPAHRGLARATWGARGRYVGGVVGWPPLTTGRRRSATSWSSPVRSRPSCGFRPGWRSPSVPRRAAVLARGAGRRPARQRLLRAAARLRARADAREHARGARGGAADPPAHRARLAAGQRRRRRRGCSPRSPPPRRSARPSVRCRCCAGDVIGAGALPEVARTWWLGDAAGALVVDSARARLVSAAAARLGARPRGRGGADARRRRRHERDRVSQRRRPLAYLVFPALGWAALRFGRRGATLAIAIAVGFAVWNTTHYHGPFVFDSITLSVLTTQLYIAVAALSTLSPRRAGRPSAGSSPRGSRVARAPGQGVRHRAPAPRAQPPRRRPAAPDRARHPAGDGRRDARATLTSRARRCSRQPGQVIARDRGAARARARHPPAGADRRRPRVGDQAASPRARPCRSRSCELPSTRLDDTAEATAYYVFAEALDQRAEACARLVDARPRHDRRRTLRARDRRRRRRRRNRDRRRRPRRPARPRRGARRHVHVDSPAGHGTRIAATIPARRTSGGAGYGGRGRGSS